MIYRPTSLIIVVFIIIVVFLASSFIVVSNSSKNNIKPGVGGGSGGGIGGGGSDSNGVDSVPINGELIVEVESDSILKLKKTKTDVILPSEFGYFIFTLYDSSAQSKHKTCSFKHKL